VALDFLHLMEVQVVVILLLVEVELALLVVMEQLLMVGMVVQGLMYQIQ
jgi:hypothetical protein